MKIENVLTEYGLDFDIVKIPLLGYMGGEYINTPYYGLLNSKTNEILNTTKEGYTVSQNKDVVMRVLNGISGYDNLEIVDGGSINGGRRVYFKILINTTNKIGESDIKRYITLIDSNDGSAGLSVGIGDVVTSSNNGFFRFYSGGHSKFRHTTSLHDNIDEIPKLIELALNESEHQFDVYTIFNKTNVKDNVIDNMVKKVLGYNRVITNNKKLANLSPKSLGLMKKLYDSVELECDINGNTLWGVFNGLTRYTTHEMISPNRDNGKMESMLVGNSYKKSLIGYEFLLKNI